MSPQRLEALFPEVLLALLRVRPHRRGRLPAVTPLIATGGPADEDRLRTNAVANNREIVAALIGADLPLSVINEQPATIYNKGNLRDAWGSPIAFLPRFDPQIGMALRDRPFFVSAGPDQKFLTLEDNFYSYEGVLAPQNQPATVPAGEEGRG